MFKYFLAIPLLCCSFSCAALAEGSFVFGAEGFYGKYEEKAIGVEDHTKAGSLTAGYEYQAQKFFGALEGRFSYGENDYKSPDSGKALKSKPAYEGDLRALGGINIPLGENNILRPYFGVGGRYLYDHSKGSVSDLGNTGYDRRIGYIYAPIGISYEHKIGNGFTFKPKLEYDAFLGGNVRTKLSSYPGGSDFSNRQKAFSGYGLRSELMIAFDAGSVEWEFGPFVRYWSIDNSQSTTVTDPDTGSEIKFIEPENTTLQTGLSLRVRF